MMPQIKEIKKAKDDGDLTAEMGVKAKDTEYDKADDRSVLVDDT